MAGQQAGDDVQGWILDCVVGSGSFATVWKAHKQTGDVLSYAAVKIIATERLSPKLKQSLECEVSILKRIKHTNVVKLHDVAKVNYSMPISISPRIADQIAKLPVLDICQ